MLCTDQQLPGCVPPPGALCAESETRLPEPRQDLQESVLGPLIRQTECPAVRQPLWLSFAAPVVG